MSRSLVSVIIPVRNGARYLGDAITSVLAQTYSPIEILVVFGPSTDATEKIARSFPQVRVLPEPETGGLAAARNLGISEAKGEWIAFLSHDDLWDPEKARAQVDVFEARADVDYVATRVQFFQDEAGLPPPGFRAPLLVAPQIGAMPEALMVRAQLFGRIGGFLPGYQIGEDVEWVVRAQDAGAVMGIVDRVLVKKRVHSTNLSLRPDTGATFHRDLLGIARQSIERRRQGGRGD